MLVIITFMLEPAKLQMNWARARGMSTLRSDWAEADPAAVLAMGGAGLGRVQLCFAQCRPPLVVGPGDPVQVGAQQEH